MDSIPAALTLRGWALLPPTWTSWMQLLAALPVDLPPLAAPLRSGEWNDVFTDGSCLASSCPLVRCAAWSVTLAAPFHAGWTPGQAKVLCASFLPGLVQTAYRAELFAVAYTLHWAALLRAPVRIWTDCLGVITRFNLLIWGCHRLNVNRSNSDLWQWILNSVAVLGRERVSLCKVKAHCTLHSATSLRAAWKIFYNDYADRAARLANQARPAEFWRVWDQHARAVESAAHIYSQVSRLHIAVGRRHVRHGDPEPAEAPPSVRETRQFAVQFERGRWTGNLLPKLARLYGTAISQKAIRWFLARIVEQEGVSPVWVSYTQLYLDFQLTWGHPGPLRVHQQWVDTDQRPYLAAESFHFRQRVKWFKQFLKAMFKEADIKAAIAQCRPQSGIIQAFVPSVSVPWDPQSLLEVERWLATQVTTPCVRDAAILYHLPLAMRCDRMQV